MATNRKHNVRKNRKHYTQNKNSLKIEHSIFARSEHPILRGNRTNNNRKIQKKLTLRNRTYNIQKYKENEIFANYRTQ